jgi:hypothetical protein
VESQTRHKSRNSKLRDIGRHRPARRLVDRVRASVFPRNFSELFGVVKLKAAVVKLKAAEEDLMGLGRGLLLWLIGIPLPIIILIALFMHH